MENKQHKHPNFEIWSRGFYLEAVAVASAAPEISEDYNKACKNLIEGQNVDKSLDTIHSSLTKAALYDSGSIQYLDHRGYLVYEKNHGITQLIDVLGTFLFKVLSLDLAL